MDLLVIIILIAVLVLAYFWTKRDKSYEKFGTVMGQLAPYREQLAHCVTECNRSDPSNRLLPQANINCGRYCEAIISEMANRGIPPERYPISNNMTICEKQCDNKNATYREKRKCINACHGQREVAQWCKELWCPYSLKNSKDCMKSCFATQNINNSDNSWTWGRYD